MGSAYRYGLLTLLVVSLAGCAGGMSARPISGLRPAASQPTPDQLAPGLAVQYTYAIMNGLVDMRGRPFESGPPLTHLDWQMGTGRVLTSKAREGVGAMITGFVLLETPGKYGFDVTSNDGVRLEIGDVLLHENAGVHADTTSDRIDVDVERPGWYPIKILYFQKQGTATLVVRWAEPGGAGRLTPLPARVLAHPK
jgi:PA14 domain-containing protein